MMVSWLYFPLRATPSVTLRKEKGLWSMFDDRETPSARIGAYVGTSGLVWDSTLTEQMLWQEQIETILMGDCQIQPLVRLILSIQTSRSKFVCQVD